jgi:predicted polyphosphate/ATP-dependent NAD kinase
MSKVGIIANPASGKDIRRLVSCATVVGNNKKIDIIRRVIIALSSTGVDEILTMPDPYHLTDRALDGIKKRELKCQVRNIDMLINNSAEDSIMAARLMEKQGVDCIITIGGDGTNRVVAIGCGSVPIVPISTGTNNVFPFMVEGTIAGLTAGIIAQKFVDVNKRTTSTKKLNIIKNNRSIDLALIDAVVMDEIFIGSKAIWDLSQVREVVATQGHPSYIGMSSIGGCLHPIKANDNHGLYLRIGKGNTKIKAAIAPGLIKEVEIEKFQVLNLNDRIKITDKPALIALDGEREIKILPQDEVEIELRRDGPRIVKMKETLEEAVEKGFFLGSSKGLAE